MTNFRTNIRKFQCASLDKTAGIENSCVALSILLHSVILLCAKDLCCGAWNTNISSSPKPFNYISKAQQQNNAATTTNEHRKLYSTKPTAPQELQSSYLTFTNTRRFNSRYSINERINHPRTYEKAEALRLRRRCRGRNSGACLVGSRQ